MGEQNGGKPSGQSDAVAKLVELNLICEEFEVAFRGGAEPRIEDYLTRMAGADRAELLTSLVALETELLYENGLAVNEEGYRERFPDGQQAVVEGLRRCDGLGVDDDPSHPSIDGYELVDQIGEGGFGLVFVANQLEPIQRSVAVKVIKPGMDSREIIRRFEGERQALAVLDHSGIAKVFDAGTTSGGRPYFVMELVDGSTLTDFCDQQSLSIRERLKLFLRVCNAIHHAHQKGIIHRDIKPSNILVAHEDGEPVPKVIDFGIAKAIQTDHEKGTLTVEQQFMGTPAYVSPEQAQYATDIDTRSDVYSLGVLLYELLVGNPPLDIKSLIESGFDDVRRAIRNQRALSPSMKLNSLETSAAAEIATNRGTGTPMLHKVIHGDLDWIAMKCLEKERSRRYDSASSLADDVQRFLNSEPVLAHPPSKMYQAAKLLEQHRTSVAAAAVAVLLLVGTTLLSVNQARKASAAEVRLRRSTYVAEMNVAFDALQENNLSRATDFLNRQRPKPGTEDLRGFEWRYLWKRCRSDEVGSMEGRTQSIRFSPDGKFLVTSGMNKTGIRDGTSFELIEEIPRSVNAPCVSISPDSELLAIADRKEIGIFQCGSWEKRKTLEGNMACAFSPDGRYFASLSTQANSGYNVWDARTWDKIGTVGTHTIDGPWASRKSLVFSADGTLLVTACHDAESKTDWFSVWQVPKLIRKAGFEQALGDIPTTALFLDGDRWLLTGHWNGSILLWNVATGELIRRVGLHQGFVTELALAPDGRTFASASADRIIRLWDTATFDEVDVRIGHTAQVYSAAYSVDGKTLVSAETGKRGKLRFWHAHHRDVNRVPVDGRRLAGFSDDSKKLVSLSSRGASIINLESGRRSEISLGLERNTARAAYQEAVAFGSGPTTVTGAPSGEVAIYDEAELVASWLAHGGPTDMVALSRDKRRLATGSREEGVAIWDFATRQEIARFPNQSDHLTDIALSTDGSILVASVGSRHRSLVWNVDQQTAIGTLHGFEHHVSKVAFSPDNSMIVAASYDDRIRVWNANSLEMIATMEGHVSGIVEIDFSPDGKTLASCAGTTVKLWNMLTFRELASLNFGRVFSLQFSPDGRTLAVLDHDRELGVRFLEAPSWREINAAEKTSN